MKALKEKRIGLRSLWRRGLVILSLFALVFASCNQTEGDSEPTTEPPAANGRVPYAIDVWQQPTEDSLMGLPLDLTGIKVMVRYTDGSTSWLTDADAAKFTTEPRWATGAYSTAPTPGTGSLGTFTPLYQYRLYYSENGVIVPPAEVTVNDVIPIIREDTRLSVVDLVGKDPLSGNHTGSFYQSNGLQIIGYTTNQKVKEMYVDDTADLTGIELAANYRKVNGNQYTDDLALQPKKVDFTLDMDWRVIPYYDNGKDTGRGGLYLTVGRNPLNDSDPLMTYNHRPGTAATYDALGVANNKPADLGVTAVAALDAVWHATKLELVEELEMEPFFYWYTDDNDSWIKRVDSAKLRVTYSNDKTKDFTVPEALYQNTVWLNNIQDGKVNYNNGGLLTDKTTSIYDWRPFAVEGILDTAKVRGIDKEAAQKYLKLSEPQIGLYYRGVRTWVPVTVFDTYDGVEVLPLDGGAQVTIDMRGKDNDYQGMNATEFSKMITVNALFSAHANPEAGQIAFPLKFKDSNSPDPGTDGVPGFTPDAKDGNELYYSMNFGVRENGTTVTAGWGISNTVKNNAQKNVTIYYANPDGQDVDSAGPASTIKTKNKKGTILVEWVNVPAKS